MQNDSCLQTSALLVRGAASSDAVRRALRAYLLGITPSAVDVRALHDGVRLLDHALKLQAAPSAPSAIAGLRDDGRFLSILREVWQPGVPVEVKKLKLLRNALNDVAEGQKPASSDVQQALDLFFRLNVQALINYRALQDAGEALPQAEEE